MNQPTETAIARRLEHRLAELRQRKIDKRKRVADAQNSANNLSLAEMRLKVGPI